MSNIWQEMVLNPTLAVTATVSFPITNAIMGTLFPLYIVVMLLTILITLFGKSSGEGASGLR